MSKKIVFFGTPNICIPYLSKLYNSSYTIAAVVCNPDRPVGRKHILTPPSTKLWAAEHDIPIIQPEKLDAEACEILTSYQANLYIVIAYGSIIPKKLIETPEFGTLNVHYSHLPRWRGASPVEASILHGDTSTSMTIQQMRYRLDSGPTIASLDIPLYGDEFSDELTRRLSELGSELLIDTLPKVFERSITLKEQDEDSATFCRKITKDDAQILESDNDITKWRKYRAYYGWPQVWYKDSRGKRVKITKARFEHNMFIIEKIIPEGGKEQDYILASV